MARYIDPLWIMFLITQLEIGNTSSDADRCISKGISEEFMPQYCLVTRGDVKLSCPEHEVIVLTSLQLAVKDSREVCTQRVIGSRNEFCCISQLTDVLYDARCLHGVWNQEDTIHYHRFISDALTRCSNKSECMLNSKLFSNLQKRIPDTKKYSSYFQVHHRCLRAPTTTVNLCATTTMSGNGIHIQSPSKSSSQSNKTCTCSVTSHGQDVVMVMAVDVRVTTSGLLLRSDNKLVNISHGHSPVFGFKTLVTGRKIDISLIRPPKQVDDTIWLYVKGSNGKNARVACGGAVPMVQRTTRKPGQVNINTRESDLYGVTSSWEHLPLVYIGAGSLFTILIVVCILGGIYICRRSNRKTRRSRHPCGCPTLKTTGDVYGPPYGTVLDEHPYTRNPTGSRLVGNPHYTGNPPNTGRVYDNPYMRQSRPPTIPPLPPPNFNRKSQDCSEETLNGQGNPFDVSQLEAFLESNDIREEHIA